MEVETPHGELRLQSSAECREPLPDLPPGAAEGAVQLAPGLEPVQLGDQPGRLRRVATHVASHLASLLPKPQFEIHAGCAAHLPRDRALVLEQCELTVSQTEPAEFWKEPALDRPHTGPAAPEGGGAAPARDWGARRVQGLVPQERDHRQCRLRISRISFANLCITSLPSRTNSAGERPSRANSVVSP